MMSFRKICRLLALTPLLFAACDDARLHDTGPRVAFVKIVVDPTQPSYDIGDEVKLDYLVFDWLGNRVEGISGSWSNPDPEGAQLLGDGRFRFRHIGAYTWSITLAPPYNLVDQVTLNVPARPATLEITVAPDQDHYLVGDQVAFTLHVYDQEGNPMTGVEADWQVPAPAQARDDGGLNFTLLQEGLLTWTATVTPGQLSTSRTLLVDGSGPQLVLESPERGDTILVDGAPATITVAGTVSDQPAGLAALRVWSNLAAAEDVTPDAGGNFSVQLPAAAGLNAVVVEASDTAGNVTRLVRSAQLSSDFFSLDADSQGRSHLPDTETILLGPSAFDRGSRHDLPAYDPCTLDGNGQYVCTEVQDLATVLELALNRLDFAASQPDQQFNWPLVDQGWVFDLTDEIQVSATLEGDFDVSLGFSSLRAGLAKVDELRPQPGGLSAAIDFGPTGPAAGDRPGLDVSYGLLATLTFNIWLDLTATDPAVQVGLCLLADTLCNPDPPNDCLSDYLLACNLPGQALPIAQAVSSLDTPTLVALSVDHLPVAVQLSLGLNGQQQPQADLLALDADLSAGTLDASALEDITINIGTIRFAGFEIDLGSYQLPSTFISDIADQLLDPLLNALKPVLELLLEQFFSCRDENNPLCYLIPLLEGWLSDFASSGSIEVAGPGGATASIELQPRFDSLNAADTGLTMVVAQRAQSTEAPQLAAHRDDDHLGQALLDGCLEGRSDYGGGPAGAQPVRLAKRLDYLNSLWLAIWRAGGFDGRLDQADVQLGGEYQLRSLSLQLAPWLPPVLSDCRDGELVLQLGDLEVVGNLQTLAGDQLAFTAWLSVASAARLELQGTSLVLVLEQAPLWSEVELGTLTTNGQPDTVRSEFVRGMLRELSGQLLEHLAAPVSGVFSGLSPRTDISPLFDLPAQSAWWQLLFAASEHQPQHLVGDGYFAY